MWRAYMKVVFPQCEWSLQPGWPGHTQGFFNLTINNVGLCSTIHASTDDTSTLRIITEGRQRQYITNLASLSSTSNPIVLLLKCLWFLRLETYLRMPWCCCCCCWCQLGVWCTEAGGTMKLVPTGWPPPWPYGYNVSWIDNYHVQLCTH